MLRFCLCVFLCGWMTLPSDTALALPKGTPGTHYQNCSYVWVWDEESGYMEQVYVCGDPIYLPAGEEEVPYEGCYYGEDCYDDYVTDP